MTQEPSLELQRAPRSFIKNLKMLLAGAAFGIFVVVLQIFFSPAPVSMFSAQDRPRGPEWFVLFLRIREGIFSFPLQIFYVCVFVALLILRPNHRSAWLYALIVGYSTPMICFHFVEWIVRATVPP